MRRVARLQKTVERLRAAGCVAPEEEADDLLAAASDGATLEALLCRRERGEPLAWLTGTSQFCGRALRVDIGVYVPRIQSEQLALRAAALLACVGGDPQAVDLCTGSGAVASHLSSAVPSAQVVAVDVDVRAAACARRNGVHAIVGDLGAPLVSGSFDVVTAVAPYVPTSQLQFLPSDVLRYEPRRALDGGEDGLDLVRMVVVAAAKLLRPGGWLLTEVGGEQDLALAPTLKAHGFGSSSTWSDDDGDLRGLLAQRH
jgi:release factor glutamine methyltransferase